jgi:hypothetical protein
VKAEQWAEQGEASEQTKASEKSHGRLSFKGGKSAERALTGHATIYASNGRWARPQCIAGTIDWKHMALITTMLTAPILTLLGIQGTAEKAVPVPMS